MRILLLLPYSPIPPTFGGALRNYHLLKHLARHHDVTVLTYGTPEVADSIAAEFSLRRGRVRAVPKQWMRGRWRLGQLYAVSTGHSFFHLIIGRSRRMQEAIDEVLSEEAFDIVQKAIDRAMVLTDLHLVEKAGGRTGHWRRGATDRRAGP